MESGLPGIYLHLALLQAVQLEEGYCCSDQFSSGSCRFAYWWAAAAAGLFLLATQSVIGGQRWEYVAQHLQRSDGLARLLEFIVAHTR